MKPILLEIVTLMIITVDQCTHCSILFHEAGIRQRHRQQEFDEYPKDLRDESAQLSDWIHDLKRLYKHRLLIRLIEAQSLTGIYKSLRHRIRRYPAFIIEGKETVSGWDKARLEGLLDRHVPRKPRR